MMCVLEAKVLYMCGENNFRFYHCEVPIAKCACEKETIWITAYGPDVLRLICLWCRAEILQHHKMMCMKQSVLKV